MSFISTNCPGCGTPIELDESREYGFCQFCGTKIVQDRIVVQHQGSVKVDNSDLIVKYRQNAQRALDKHDWEEVEKYYNLIEMNTENNMEAVFFSSYGKAMLSLTDDDYYKRQQKFDVLNRSMSVISDYYDVTDEDKEKVLRKIKEAIDKMYEVNFVYQRQEFSLVGALNYLASTVGSKPWCVELINSTKNAFLTELQQIYEKHKDDFVDELIKEITVSLKENQETKKENKEIKKENKETKKEDNITKTNTIEENMSSPVSETSSPVSETANTQTQNLKNGIVQRIKRVIHNYKNFKNLSTKKKILYIAVPIIILFLLFCFFSDGGVSDKAYIAAAQECVTDPTCYGMYIESDLDFTGGEVVDKDKYGRALVLLKYDSQITEDSQVIVVIYDVNETEYHYYRGKKVAFYGSEITKDDIKECKEMVDWGEPI